LTHIDPSWCARINAHRHSSAEAASLPAAKADDARTSPPASGSPYRLREVPKEHVCECCGTVMYDHHCKIVCPNCGYKRDCSDP
jgi:Zn finger protein HypA/HybF involved in hydrogenase expression